MKNILIPLDLNHSKLEEKILETAISHAQQLKSKCWLVHINKTSLNQPQQEVKHLKNYTVENIREEQRKLQLIVDLFDEHKINNEGLFIRASSMAYLQEEIKALNIDLLILGNSDSYFEQMFLTNDTLKENMNQIQLSTLIIPNN